jgi:lysophospholipid acyltransferase
MNVFQREKQHVIVFVVLFMYQSGIHLVIMYRKYGEWGTEITSFTMNLVCKLISVAMCYRDASPKCKDDNDNDMRLAKMPSFFKMTAYTFNLPSCIASPFYEYKDFEDWIELKGRYKNIPDPKRHGIIRFSNAIGWIAVTATLGIWFDIKNLVGPDFCNMPWYMKLWHTYFTSHLVRQTYYLAWSFIDSGMIFSGFAYNGTDEDGTVQYDRYSNIKWTEIEFGTSVKRMAYHWNITIQAWMKKYVYMRIISKNEDPPVWKFIIVFIISAIWHGFYPCYYLFFFT